MNDDTKVAMLQPVVVVVMNGDRKVAMLQLVVVMNDHETATVAVTLQLLVVGAAMKDDDCGSAEEVVLHHDDSSAAKLVLPSAAKHFHGKKVKVERVEDETLVEEEELYDQHPATAAKQDGSEVEMW